MDRKMAVFAAMGFEIAGLVIAGVYFGGWADKTFGWGGLGVAAAIGAALIGWIIHLLMLAKKFERESAEDESRGRQEPPDQR